MDNTTTTWIIVALLVLLIGAAIFMLLRRPGGDSSLDSREAPVVDRADDRGDDLTGRTTPEEAQAVAPDDRSARSDEPFDQSTYDTPGATPVSQDQVSDDRGPTASPAADRAGADGPFAEESHPAEASHPAVEDTRHHEPDRAGTDGSPTGTDTDTYADDRDRDRDGDRDRGADTEAVGAMGAVGAGAAGTEYVEEHTKGHQEPLTMEDQRTPTDHAAGGYADDRADGQVIADDTAHRDEHDRRARDDHDLGDRDRDRGVIDRDRDDDHGITGRDRDHDLGDRDRSTTDRDHDLGDRDRSTTDRDHHLGDQDRDRADRDETGGRGQATDEPLTADEVLDSRRAEGHGAHDRVDDHRSGAGGIAAGAAATAGTVDADGTTDAGQREAAPVQEPVTGEGRSSAGTDDAVFAESVYGPGSAEPAEDGSGPAGWEIKGNTGSMLFHTPDSPSWDGVRAEVWFESEEAARGAGFAHWDRRRR